MRFPWLGDYGWFYKNSRKCSGVTAVKPPTVGGQFDAHGNLFEWTHDWYASIESGSSLVDLQGASGGGDRVLRGGSWLSDAADCRTAARGTTPPWFRTRHSGLRLALSLPSGVQSPEAEGTK